MIHLYLFKSTLILTLILQLSSCKTIQKVKIPQRINHIVICWLKDSGNKEQQLKIIRESLKFKNIPGVLELRAGSMIPSDRKIVDSSFDVAIYMTHHSIKDMNRYLKHPKHVKAVKEVLKPLMRKIVVYDFMETNSN